MVHSLLTVEVEINAHRLSGKESVVKLIGGVVFGVEISDSKSYIVDFQHIMSVIVGNEIHQMTIRQCHVPVLWRVDKTVQDLQYFVVAEVFHVTHVVAAVDEAWMSHRNHPVLLT